MCLFVFVGCKVQPVETVCCLNGDLSFHSLSGRTDSELLRQASMGVMKVLSDFYVTGNVNRFTLSCIWFSEVGEQGTGFKVILCHLGKLLKCTAREAENPAGMT